MSSTKSVPNTPQDNVPALVPSGRHAGKPAFPLNRPVTIVGSSEDCRLRLESTSVSHHHAVIVHSNGGTYVHDLASRTHIYVNGRAVREAELHEGDLLSIGNFTLKFSVGKQLPGLGVSPPPEAKLDVLGADLPVPIAERVMLVGRRSTCDVALVEESVSTCHAVIFEMDGQRYLRDLHSRTGTFLDGRKIHQEVLSDGAEIRIGETAMRYVATEAKRAATPKRAAREAAPVVAPVPAAREPVVTEIETAEAPPIEIDTDPALDLETDSALAPAAPARSAEAEVDLTALHDLISLDADDLPAPKVSDTVQLPAPSEPPQPVARLAGPHVDVQTDILPLSEPDEEPGAVEAEMPSPAPEMRLAEKDLHSQVAPAEIVDLDSGAELSARTGWRSGLLETVADTEPPSAETLAPVEPPAIDLAAAEIVPAAEDDAVSLTPEMPQAPVDAAIDLREVDIDDAPVELPTADLPPEESAVAIELGEIDIDDAPLELLSADLSSVESAVAADSDEIDIDHVADHAPVESPTAGLTAEASTVAADAAPEVGEISLDDAPVDAAIMSDDRQRVDEAESLAAIEFEPLAPIDLTTPAPADVQPPALPVVELLTSELDAPPSPIDAEAVERDEIDFAEFPAATASADTAAGLPPVVEVESNRSESAAGSEIDASALIDLSTSASAEVEPATESETVEAEPSLRFSAEPDVEVPGTLHTAPLGRDAWPAETRDDSSDQIESRDESPTFESFVVTPAPPAEEPAPAPLLQSFDLVTSDLAALDPLNLDSAVELDEAEGAAIDLQSPPTSESPEFVVADVLPPVAAPVAEVLSFDLIVPETDAPPARADRAMHVELREVSAADATTISVEEVLDSTEPTIESAIDPVDEALTSDPAAEDDLDFSPADNEEPAPAGEMKTLAGESAPLTLNDIEPPLADVEQPADLSDTSLGRTVEEFTAQDSGALVEEPVEGLVEGPAKPPSEARSELAAELLADVVVEETSPAVSEAASLELADVPLEFETRSERKADVHTAVDFNSEALDDELDISDELDAAERTSTESTPAPSDFDDELAAADVPTPLIDLSDTPSLGTPAEEAVEPEFRFELPPLTTSATPELHLTDGPELTIEDEMTVEPVVAGAADEAPLPFDDLDAPVESFGAESRLAEFRTVDSNDASFVFTELVEPAPPAAETALGAKAFADLPDDDSLLAAAAGEILEAQVDDSGLDLEPHVEVARVEPSLELPPPVVTADTTLAHGSGVPTENQGLLLGAPPLAEVDDSGLHLDAVPDVGPVLVPENELLGVDFTAPSKAPVADLDEGVLLGEEPPAADAAADKPLADYEWPEALEEVENRPLSNVERSALFGLGTDQENFIGGMPLGLLGAEPEAEAPPPSEAFGQTIVTLDRPDLAQSTDQPCESSAQDDVRRTVVPAPAKSEVPAVEPSFSADTAEVSADEISLDDAPATQPLDEDDLFDLLGEPDAQEAPVEVDEHAAAEAMDPNAELEPEPAAELEPEVTPEPAAGAPPAVPARAGAEEESDAIPAGFEGLVIGTGRSTDVFATQSPAAPFDPFGGGSPEVHPDDLVIPGATEKTRKSRPGPRLRGESSSVSFPGETVHADSESPRRPPRRRLGVPSLFVLMVLSLVTALASVLLLMPPRYRVDAAMTVKNLETRDESFRASFLAEQRSLLSSETEEIRIAALAALAERSKDVSAGFLGDVLTFHRMNFDLKLNASAGNSFLMSFDSYDRKGDVERAHALLTSLYRRPSNLVRVDEIGALRKRIGRLEEELESGRKSIDSKAQEIEVVRNTALARPTVEAVEALRSAVLKSEQLFESAIAKVRARRVELEALMSANNDLPTGASRAPDEEVVAMGTELATLTAQLEDMARSTRPDADTARKALAESIAQLEQQIAAIQNGMQGNPELIKYVSAARKLQDYTRQMAADFRQRQQEQYSQLNKLKQQLDDKLNERRQKAMASDEKLKGFMDQHALATRRYNAAIGQALTDEAAEIKAEVALLSSMIKAQQAKVGKDDDFEDAIASIQEIITTTYRMMEDDRKRADEMIKQLQDEFAATDGVVEKLPAEQKAVAEQLRQKLAEMSKAREAYAGSMREKDEAAVETRKQAEERVAVLTTKIAARKQELELAAAAASDEQRRAFAADRKRKIEQKREELKLAEAAEEEVRTTYSASRRELEATEQKVTQAREAAQKNDQLNEERAELMREREQMDNALANARKQLAGLVEPIAPDAASVRIEPYEDHRTMVLGGSMVGIVVVFGAMILLSLQNQKPTTPSPVGGKASRNGNGAAAEEEDEAAVMA